MNKTSLITGLIISVALLLVPMTGFSQMSPMSSGEMDEVTAQKGLQISVEDIGFDMSAETIYYADEDGVGGNSGAGYLSLTGVDLQGAIHTSEPVQVDMGLSTIDSMNEMTSLNFTMQNAVVEVDNFTIDAIRVGSAPGEGKSFGKIGIENMRTEISGKVQIGTH